MNAALKVRYSELQEEVKSLKESIARAPLQEKQSDHWPYKNKSHLGPGPKGGEHEQADDWECVCSDYECDCEDKLSGETKRVKIKKPYKKRYNALYKAWRAGKMSKESMKSKLGKKKK